MDVDVILYSLWAYVTAETEKRSLLRKQTKSRSPSKKRTKKR